MANARLQKMLSTRRINLLAPDLVLLSSVIAVSMALGLTDIIPMSFALWFPITAGSIWTVMHTYIRIAKSIDNLRNGRKQFKSTASLIVVPLSMIIGAFVGYNLGNIDSFASALQGFITSQGSILFTAGLTTSAITIAFMMNKSPVIGVFIGLLVGSLYIPNIPVPIEFAFLGTMVMGLASSLVAKHALRLYYKLRHGHSNADGYYEGTSPQEVTAKEAKQAALFNVTPTQYKQLKDICKEGIKGIKERSTLTEYSRGVSSELSSSFKTIYHSLTRANDETDAKNLRTLLQASDLQVGTSFVNDNGMGYWAKQEDATLRPKVIKFENDDSSLPEQFALFRSHLIVARDKLREKQDTYASLDTRFNAAMAPFVSKR